MAPGPGSPSQGGREEPVFPSAGINFSTPVHLQELIVSEEALFLAEKSRKDFSYSFT